MESLVDRGITRRPPDTEFKISIDKESDGSGVPERWRRDEDGEGEEQTIDEQKKKRTKTGHR